MFVIRFLGVRGTEGFKLKSLDINEATLTGAYIYVVVFYFYDDKLN